MSKDVTTKRVLAFIQDFIREHLYSPSIREIVEGCHLSSTSVAYHHVVKLNCAGCIKSRLNKARTIVLTGKLYE